MGLIGDYREAVKLTLEDFPEAVGYRKLVLGVFAVLGEHQDKKDLRSVQTMPQVPASEIGWHQDPTAIEQELAIITKDKNEPQPVS